jgi:hypothetical protein
VTFLKPCFQACIDLTFYLIAFCHYNTIFPGKLGREHYSVPEAWQPIAPLNTLKKVLDSVIDLQILSLS